MIDSKGVLMASIRRAFWFSYTASVAVLAGILFAQVAVAQSQETRYANPQLGVSFQPPSGWTADNVVRYLGPERDDGTWPVLTLISHDSALDLSDSGTAALAQEMIDTLEGQGIGNVQVSDRRKRSVSGFDAFQMDLTYQQGGIPIRQRLVYVPVAEHRRTYLFTLVDTARRFNESAPSVENAIASFTPSVSRAADAGLEPGPQGGAGMWTLPLVLLGVIALAMIIGAVYLLVRNRTAA
jgi:hypothetical protein